MSKSKFTELEKYIDQIYYKYKTNKGCMSKTLFVLHIAEMMHNNNKHFVGYKFGSDFPVYDKLKNELHNIDYMYQSEQEFNYDGLDQELIDAIKNERLLPDRDVAFTIGAVNAFHSQFMKFLFRDNVSFDFESLNYDSFAERAFIEFDLEKQGQPQQVVNDIEYVLSHKEDVIRLHKEYLKQFNIETINELDVQKEAEGQLVKDSAAAQSDNHLKYSAKQTATNYMRLIISSLLKIRPSGDGRWIETENRYFPFAELVDFGETFSMLANSLASTPTLEKMKAKLGELKKDKDGIAQLEQIIFKDEYDHESFLRMAGFVQTFKKHFNKFNLVFMGEGGVYNYMDTLATRVTDRLLSDWNKNFGQHIRNKQPWIKFHKEGRVAYNQEWFDKYLGKGVGVAISSPAMTEDNQYFQKLIGLNEIQEAFLNGVPKNFVEDYTEYFKTTNLLALLGIDISTNALPELDFYNAVEGLFKVIIRNTDYNILGEHSDASGYLSRIMQHELDNSTDIYENQHFNADNESVYNVNLNNYVTNVLNYLNDASSLEEVYLRLPHLNNDFSNSGLLLNGWGVNKPAYNFLFDAEGNRVLDNKLEMQFMEDVKQEGAFKGTPFRKLKAVDKLAGMINSAILDTHPLFVPADNSLKREFPLIDFVSQTDNTTKLFVETLFQEAEYFKSLIQSENQYVKASGFTPSKVSIFGSILAETNLSEVFDNYVLNEGEFDAAQIRKFERGFEKFIQNKVEKLQKELEDNLVIVRDGERFANYGLTGSVKRNKRNPVNHYTQEQITKKLTKATLNRAIWNVEQMRLFSGHPIFFGTADNFYKRMSAMVGTKENNLTDPEIVNNAKVLFPRKGGTTRKYVNYNNADPNIPIDQQIFLESENVVLGEEDKLVYSTLVHADVEVQSNIMSELSALNKDAYGNINEADAASYSHLDAYRDLSLFISDWSLGKEKLYQWIMNGRKPVTFKWKGQDIEVNSGKIYEGKKRVVFNALKPQYYGPGVEIGLVPSMYKTGMLPLIPTVEPSVTNDMIAQLEKHNAEFLTFESANKVGMKLNDGKKQSFYDISGDVATLSTTPKVVQYSFAEHWGIQLKTGKHRKPNVTKGSQVSKLVTVDFYDQGVPKEGADESGLTDLVKQYEIDHARLIEIGVQELRTELSLTKDDDGNYNKESLERLIDLLQTESLQRGANDNVLTGLEYLRYYINRGLGFEVLSNNDKVENILMSIADKRIFSQKMPGGMYVQTPPTPFESAEREVRKGKIVGSKKLKMRADGSMEIMVPNIFNADFTDISSIEIDPRLLEGLGFRIPTSGMNSIERVVIVGFLDPAHGDTIVLPSEIAAKAGSDYDIDKLNVFFKNYKKIYKPEVQRAVNKFLAPIVPKDTMKNSIVRLLRDVIGDEVGANDIEKTWSSMTKEERIEFLHIVKDEAVDSIIEGFSPLSEQFYSDVDNKFIEIEQSLEKIVLREDNEKQTIQNRLIETAAQIITHPLNREIHQESIGTDLFLEQKKYIMELRGESEQQASFSDIVFDIAYNYQVEQRNLASKRLTGIAALHNTDHTNAQRHGYMMFDTMPFKDGYHKQTVGDKVNVLLGKLKDVDGLHYISSVLIQQINAAVDGAKEPMFAELNITEETMPVISFMVRAGVSLKNTLLFINQPSVRYYTMLQDIRQSNMNTGWLDNRKPDNTDPDFFFTQKDTTFKPENNMVKYLTEIKFGVGSQLIDFSTLEKNLSSNTNQANMWNAYVRVKELASTLDEYMRGTRLETTSNKNTAELDLNKAVADKIAKGQSDIINADKAVNEGFLKPFYEAYAEIQDIYSDYFIQYKYKDSGFRRVYDHFVDKLTGEQGKFISLNNKTRILTNLRQDFSAYMVNNSKINIGGRYWGIPNDHIERLFVGPNSIAHRVTQYDGDNHLIKNIIPVFGETPVYLLGKQQVMDGIILTDQRLIQQEQNELILGWRELFESDYQLASDLAVAAILQNGFKQTPTTFTKYIPSEIHMEIADSAFCITKYPEEYGDLEISSFIIYFYLNNVFINELIPYASKSQFYKMPYFRIKRKHPEYDKIQNSNNLQNIKQYINTNKPLYESFYTVCVNTKIHSHFHFMQLPKDAVVGIKSSAIIDFKNKRSLLYYPKNIGKDIIFVSIK